MSPSKRPQPFVPDYYFDRGPWNDLKKRRRPRDIPSHAWHDAENRKKGKRPPPYERQGQLPGRGGGAYGIGTGASDEGRYFYKDKEFVVSSADEAELLRVLDQLMLPRVVRFTVSTLSQDGWYLVQYDGPDDPPFFVQAMKDFGFTTSVNHVFHADGSFLLANPIHANPIHANPIYANPIHANPIYANPIYANPIYANPIYANPIYANPIYANPIYANPIVLEEFLETGVQPSSARPANAPPPGANVNKSSAQVYVLDTGLAEGGFNPFPNAAVVKASALDADLPDESVPPDKFLDPVAGHGTFIAGLVDRFSAPTAIELLRLTTTFGVVYETSVVTALNGPRITHGTNTLVNMSFSGYANADTPLLAAAIRDAQAKGSVVVASAGNDSYWRRTYPACSPNVVSVGGLGPFGPAWFTNFGTWVRACAPATDVVSRFFKAWNGNALVLDATGDPDQFKGWARWSGTSFAAPIVVAALVREMAAFGVTAQGAVTRIIDAPGLHRIPGLGTVVNIG